MDRLGAAGSREPQHVLDGANVCRAQRFVRQEHVDPCAEVEDGVDALAELEERGLVETEVRLADVADDDRDALGEHRRVDPALPSLETGRDTLAPGSDRRRANETYDVSVGVAQQVGEDERSVEARSAG